MRRLVYYVAVSVDGFIAGPDGDVSGFPQHPDTLRALFERYPETCPVHARAAMGVTAASRRFDAVLMGYRTFAPALAAGLAAGAYPHLQQYVVTHRELPGGTGVTVLRGDVATQVAALKDRPGRDIWLCGGGDLAAQLVDLVDEVQLKVNPVLLGAGTPLLGAAAVPRALDRTEVEALPGGVTLLTYRRCDPRTTTAP